MHFSFKLGATLNVNLIRAHLHTYPAGFYYSNSVWEQDHTKVDVSTSAENGPAMAGPARPVLAPMECHSPLGGIWA